MRKLYIALTAFLGISMCFSLTGSAQDVGVTTLLTPTDSTCGSTTVVIKAIVANYGSSSVSTIPVWATATGAFSVSLKDTLKKTIAAGKQDTITFRATINTAAGGLLVLKVFTNLSGDVKRADDTLITKINVITNPGPPSVTGMPLCGPLPSTLKAKSIAPARTFWYANSSTSFPFKIGDSTVPTPSAGLPYYASSQVLVPKNLTTNFTGANNQNGNMFNVKALKDITIDSFDVSPLNTGIDTVYFFYRSGFLTSSTILSASGWTNGGKCAINPASAGTGAKVRMVIPQVLLPAGNYSFYIFTYGSYSSSATSKLNYTTATTFDSTGDKSIRLFTEYGVQGYFGNGSSADFFSPRTWNGTVYYSNLYCSSSKVAVPALLSQDKNSLGIVNQGISSDPDQICVGDSLKFDISSPGNYTNADYGTKWKIAYSMATVKNTKTTNYVATNPSATVKGLFVFAPKASDADSVYILSIKVSSLVTSCDTTILRYIHVNALPVSKFTIGNACEGQTVAITNSSTPTGKLKYSWKFGNGDTSSDVVPLYKYNTAGTYTVSLTVSNSICAPSTSSKSVTSNISPYGSAISKGNPFKGQYNAGDQFDPDNVCVGDTNSYIIPSPKGFSNADYGTKWTIKNMTFLTSFGTSTKDTLTRFPTSTKNMTFTFFPKTDVDSVFQLKMTIHTLPGGCDTFMNRYIHVRVKPVAKFGFTNACVGAPILFKDSSKISISNIANWSWDFGDGTNLGTAENPSHAYAKPGSYKVTLTAVSDAGCGATISNTVTQYPHTVVKFGVVPGCNQSSTRFIDSSIVATGNIASWKWSLGDGSTSLFQNPTHVFAKSGPYNAKLVTTTALGCKDSLTKKFRVLPIPQSIFTTKFTCIGALVYTTNGSNDSAGKSIYNWNFGDGTLSTGAIPTHTYNNNGTYTVSLKVISKNGCTDSTAKIITPNPKPDVNYFFSSACVGRTVVFSDSSHSGKGTIYSWNFGDGHIDTTFAPTASHSYTKPASYKTGLIIMNGNGCTDSEHVTVKAAVVPKPSFTTKDVCLNATANFTNTTSDTGKLNYSWVFGDNSAAVTGQNETHKYAKTGAYTVKLSATNNASCTDSIKNTINVHALPPTPSWNHTHATPYTIGFIPKDTSEASYKWFFGTTNNDSSSLKKPVFTYPTADGKYQVRLVVSNAFGCTATGFDSVFMGKYNGIPVIGEDIKGISVYPNPFEGSTNILYSLIAPAHVVLKVFDAQGKEVATLKDGFFPGGEYSETFDARKGQAGPGIYFVKLLIGEQLYTTKIVNLK